VAKKESRNTSKAKEIIIKQENLNLNISFFCLYWQ